MHQLYGYGLLTSLSQWIHKTECVSWLGEMGKAVCHRLLHLMGHSLTPAGLPITAAVEHPLSIPVLSSSGGRTPPHRPLGWQTGAKTFPPHLMLLETQDCSLKPSKQGAQTECSCWEVLVTSCYLNSLHITGTHHIEVGIQLFNFARNWKKIKSTKVSQIQACRIYSASFFNQGHSYRKPRSQQPVVPSDTLGYLQPALMNSFREEVPLWADSWKRCLQFAHISVCTLCLQTLEGCFFLPADSKPLKPVKLHLQPGQF